MIGRRLSLIQYPPQLSFNALADVRITTILMPRIFRSIGDEFKSRLSQKDTAFVNSFEGFRRAAKSSCATVAAPPKPKSPK